MELVSVVVPIYNSGKFLRRCLDSILNQEYKYIEVLLVDDGSEDDSKEICSEYTDRDERFAYFYQTNAGVSAARNIGIENSNGEYICFVDSDDWLAADYIINLYNAITKEKADLAVCGVYITDGDRINDALTFDSNVICTRSDIARHYLNGDRVVLWNSPVNKIYIKNRINELFDCEMSCGEDCAFNMNYMKTAEKIVVIKDVEYYYYVPKSTETKYLKNDAKQCYLYSEGVRKFISSCLDEDEYTDAYERFVCGNLCRDAAILAKTRPFAEAKSKVREFYEFPDFCRVLENQAWGGLGIKYAIVGRLMKLKMINTLVLLSKLK